MIDVVKYLNTAKVIQIYWSQRLFSFHSGSIVFTCGQQSPTVAHDQSQSPRSVNNSFWLAHNFLLSFPFYVNKCKQTKSFVAVSWTPKRQFVENERQLHKIHACKRSSLLNLFFPTIKCYAAFEIHNS